MIEILNITPSCPWNSNSTPAPLTRTIFSSHLVKSFTRTFTIILIFEAIERSRNFILVENDSFLVNVRWEKIKIKHKKENQSNENQKEFENKIETITCLDKISIVNYIE